VNQVSLSKVARNGDQLCREDMSIVFWAYLLLWRNLTPYVPWLS